MALFLHMALFCEVRAVTPTFLAQWRDFIVGVPRIIFNLPKDMPSSQVLNFANWITIRLNYQVEIFNLNYFITQIMLSSQIAFVGVSLEIKKVLTHYVVSM